MFDVGSTAVESPPTDNNSIVAAPVLDVLERDSVTFQPLLLPPLPAVAASSLLMEGAAAGYAGLASVAGESRDAFLERIRNTLGESDFSTLAGLMGGAPAVAGVSSAPAKQQHWEGAQIG